MENLIDSQHGLPALIASLVVMFALNFCFSLFKFIWNFSSKKSSSMEADIKKMKVDLRRIFNIVRYMSGQEWTKYRKIMDDDLES